MLTHLHGDHLGSASLATDASGAKIVHSDTRYYPYGVTRPGLAGTGLSTDRRFTGQREEVSLGFYDYGARQFDPALGRFLQADTLVPDPGNPQSLNRYAYTLNNPLRYTDPSGHFSEEEINAYLEGLGYNEDERARIIAQWRDDKDWWSIIGPDGATYGDGLDGVEMLFGNRIGDIRAFFAKDEANQTFRLLLEGDAAVFSDHEMYSLVNFYSETSDVLWFSRDSSGNWVYRGGTVLAADGAKIQWEEAGNSALHTIWVQLLSSGGSPRAHSSKAVSR